MSEEKMPWEVYDHLHEVDFNEMASRRMELKERVKQISEEVKDLDMQIGAAIETAGVRGVIWEGMSVAVVDFAGRKSLIKDKLKLSLASRGVPVQVINQAIEEATKVGKPYTSIRFGGR